MAKTITVAQFVSNIEFEPTPPQVKGICFPLQRGFKNIWTKILKKYGKNILFGAAVKLGRHE